MLSLIGEKVRECIVTAFVCERCGEALKETTGASVLGSSFDDKRKIGKCIICSQECDELYLARTY